MRLSSAFDVFLQDWRHAARGLLRSPAFAIVAVTSLALGIGANTAIFSLVHDVLLARLPVRAPTELVLAQRDLGPKGTDDRFSRAEFDLLAAGPMRLTMFASSSATIDVDGVPVNAGLDAVDGGYFDLIGVRAARGRVITRGDDAGAAPVVVLSDRFWRGRMNGDPAVLGQIIKVNGQPMSVVGITPPGFAGLRFPALADIELPYRTAAALSIIRGADPRAPSLTIVGRRPAAQPIERAREPLAALWTRCCATGALVAAPRGQGVGVSSTSQLTLADISRGIPQIKLDLRGRYSRILLALMAGVGVLLLAACVNVANLLLARSSARMRELAVRAALGASRARLVTQLGVESLQLSLLGALLGALLAQWSTTVLTRAKIGDLSMVVNSEPRFSGGLLAFTIAVSVVSGLIFAIAPALRVVRSDLTTPLKQGSRRSTAGRRGFVDRGLVGVQMALALLLVSGATLLVQTLRNLQSADLGFDPAGRMALTVETRRTAYERTGMTAAMADEMLRRVRAIPGIRSAGFGSIVPVYGGRGSSDNVTVRGGVPPSDGDPTSSFAGVTPGYFASLGIPLREGRDIDPPVASATPLRIRNVVVNDRFAAKFFPGRDPLGQEFEDSDEGDSLVTVNHVIGVVGSTRFGGLRAPPAPMYFVPVADHDWPYLVLVTRPARETPAVGRDIARAIAAVAPGISQGDPSYLAASIDDALSRERVSAALAALFGTIALCLVAVGLYGVMLYQVAERTPEIGIRVALGADAPRVVTLVLRQSLAIVGAGLVGGLPLAMLAGRAVASQLYGVEPYNVVALSVAAMSLVVVGLAASLVPVRRALGVDPLTALRD